MLHLWAGAYIPPDDNAELVEVEDTKLFVCHRFAKKLMAAKIPFKLASSTCISMVVCTSAALPDEPAPVAASFCIVTIVCGEGEVQTIPALDACLVLQAELRLMCPCLVQHVIVGPTDSDSVVNVILKKAADVGAQAVVMARHGYALPAPFDMPVLPAWPEISTPACTPGLACRAGRAGCASSWQGGERIPCMLRVGSTALPASQDNARPPHAASQKPLFTVLNFLLPWCLTARGHEMSSSWHVLACGDGTVPTSAVNMDQPGAS